MTQTDLARVNKKLKVQLTEKDTRINELNSRLCNLEMFFDEMKKENTELKNHWTNKLYKFFK